MTIRKTTAALSLAVLISFGVSGCEGSFSIGNGEPTQTQSTSPSEGIKETENDAEKIRANAEVTLNELKVLSESEDFTAFYDEMRTIEGDDKEAMSKIEAILDKHKKLEDEIKNKIELSPEASRAYQGLFAMSNVNMEVKYSEKFINSAIIFSSLGDTIGSYGETSKDNTSFGVTSNAITKKDGTFALDSNGIFLKDSNNAILGFSAPSFVSLGLKDEGKKIVIENMDGQSNEGAQTESSTQLLESDVKNAATHIETWIVYQGSNVTPLVVKDGKIVSGKTDKVDLTFSISDNNNLEFEGDSNHYIITGTVKATGEKIVYDSAKGGFQERENTAVKEDKNSLAYDFTAFQKVQDASSRESFSDLESFVAYLNSSEYSSDAKFSVVDKNGTKYIKVSDPNTKIVEEEVLYISPLS